MNITDIRPLSRPSRAKVRENSDIKACACMTNNDWDFMSSMFNKAKIAEITGCSERRVNYSVGKAALAGVKS